MHRVVITGLGCISALGPDVAVFWEALTEGRSGIAETTLVEPGQLSVRIAAEVKGFDPQAHFDRGQLPLLDRFSQFALVAARQALAESGIALAGGLEAETAVIIGTGVGGLNTLDESFERLYRHGKHRVHPLTIPRLMVSAATSHISMEAGITGPAYTCSSACSSANHAIGDAFTMVRSGRVRAAVAGGTEACVTLGTLRGWEALRVMASDTCRPFSRGRQGMVLGEGAAAFVLERLDDARARGAPIHAEIVGFGMNADAGDIVLPSQAGAAQAMRLALADGALAPESVSYVNAHGTGTAVNDVTETRALRDVFGTHADRLLVSSTKSMHGHALGAAGALELVAAVKAAKHQVVPPTANFTERDPDCDLDYVPNAAREAAIDAVLSNSFAFGGLNAVLAVRRFV